ATAEDAPDALLQLAMGCEFSGKEDQAKKWYKQLADFPGNHPLTPKAKGALKRLDLKGNTMELAGPKLDGSGNFDIASFKEKNKAVVVHYWASYGKSNGDAFDRLKKLHATYNAKGLEIVCVNLDDQASDASKYLQTTPVPGVHLFQAG